MTTTDTMTMAGMMTGAIREVASRAVTASVSMTIGNASWTIAAVSWMNASASSIAIAAS